VADWVAIRAVDTFVANVPENLHLFRLFIRPRELEEFGRRSGLSTEDVFGARPALDPRGLFHLAQIALMGRVPGGFRFIRTPSLKVGYLGWGKKIA
jgi:2-polyprenyl-6-hydroxyphenyl methylase/3-demethylubiquinone-9 3-methyltransferase